MRPEQENADVHTRPASLVSGTTIWQSRFGFQIPATEKILRALGVYLGLAIIMRLAGRRQLTQLNSFDLIVMLLLSKVVQNAVIGPNYSLTGGLLGAVVLVGFNTVLERISTATKRATIICGGAPTTLVTDGGLSSWTGSSRRTARRRGHLGSASSGRPRPPGPARRAALSPRAA